MHAGSPPYPWVPGIECPPKVRDHRSWPGAVIGADRVFCDCSIIARGSHWGRPGFLEFFDHCPGQSWGLTGCSVIVPSSPRAVTGAAIVRSLPRAVIAQGSQWVGPALLELFHHFPGQSLGLTGFAVIVQIGDLTCGGGARGRSTARRRTQKKRFFFCRRFEAAAAAKKKL